MTTPNETQALLSWRRATKKPAAIAWKHPSFAIEVDDNEPVYSKDVANNIEEWLGFLVRCVVPAFREIPRPPSNVVFAPHHGSVSLAWPSAMASELRELRARVARQERITAELASELEKQRDASRPPGLKQYSYTLDLPPPPVARDRISGDVETAKLRAVFAIDDETALQSRLSQRPELQQKLLDARSTIGMLFADAVPLLLSVETGGRIIVRIPTKLSAEEAAEPMRELRTYWRKLFAVEDRVTPGLTFV